MEAGRLVGLHAGDFLPNESNAELVLIALENQQTAMDPKKPNNSSSISGMSKEDLGALRWHSVFNESDRGIVVSGVALVDDALSKLLVAKMSAHDHHVPGPIHKFRESLFLPEGNGCFSSLHSKYQIAYAMGWIPESIYKDIKIIGKIRNRAAHDFDEFSFLSTNVIKLLLKLEEFSDCDEKELSCFEGGTWTFHGSEIDYTFRGPSAKTGFITALFTIVEVLDIEARSAKIPPRGEMKLECGDIVKIHWGFSKGSFAVVRSQCTESGMVKVCPLGSLWNIREIDDDSNIYFYDLEVVGKVPEIESCEFRVGDFVKFRGRESCDYSGEVIVIEEEMKTLKVAGFPPVRGIWNEFEKCER